jgi:hypothetical protein
LEVGTEAVCDLDAGLEVGVAHHDHSIPDQLLPPVAPRRPDGIELDRNNVRAEFGEEAIEAPVALDPTGSHGPFENDGHVVSPFQGLAELSTDHCFGPPRE